MTHLKHTARASRYSYSLILLRELVITDFKLRYQSSVLGYVWSLLRPLALFAILYMVFANFLKLGSTIPHYPLYLLVGIVLWNFFTEVTGNSITAIVDKGGLLRKINFPKYVIVVATSLSAFINLLINSIVILVFAVLFKVDVGWSILYLPIFILELFCLSLGVGFLLSALFVKYRDINYIWEVLMQALFYATPILYPLALVPEGIAKVLMLNPIAQIIQDVRKIAVTPETQTIASVFDSSFARLVPMAIVLVIFAVAVIYFKRQSKFFAEEV